MKCSVAFMKLSYINLADYVT